MQNMASPLNQHLPMTLTSKINRIHPLIIGNTSAKFDEDAQAVYFISWSQCQGMSHCRTCSQNHSINISPLQCLAWGYKHLISAINEDDTNANCARNPCMEIQPLGLVQTVLFTSGPHGITGHVLNRFCNSGGDRQPSLSWEYQLPT